MDTNTARKRLEELLAELEASAAVLQHSGGADTGELSSVDQHPADSGTTLADADREEASLEVMLAQQERVRGALARIDAGTYGQCVTCGRDLPDERLDARPEAERCVDCQQKAEAAAR
ncbi:MAG TPA: TraR/DksA C4-type zinc finger protein [Mycobacteriales bacterium]|nr:TraR/DksA C4-type zinc finger protein [Mycobacteriales bacterium]